MAVTRKEWLFPLALGVIMVLLGTFPYVYGYLTQGSDETFMGFIGRGTPGANGYLMLARQALEGEWLFTNQLTPEPTPRAYFSLQWLLFGLLARWTGLSLIAVFQLSRVVSVLAYALAVYWLAAHCLEDVFKRRLATALIVFGSGFGMAVWAANKFTGGHFPLSLDLQGIGVFGYLINNPHFTRAGVCCALQYAFLIRGEQTGHLRYFVYSGLASEVHSLLRPYHVPETFLMYLAVPVLLCALERNHYRRRALHYLAAMLVALPGAIYLVVSTAANVMGMAGWQRQSPQLLEQILWLGLPYLAVGLYAAIFGMTRIRQARPSTLILSAWLLTAWLQCGAGPYLIIGHEQAFYAMTIVPAILLFLGPLPEVYALLQQYTPRIATAFTHPWGRRLAAAALIAACIPTSCYVYARFFFDLHHPVEPWRYYLRNDVRDAIAWLGQNTQPDDVVLASHATSQFIPRFTRCKVVTGHDMLTANYAEKNTLVDRFFRIRNENDFKRWLTNRFHVRYLLAGPEECLPGGIELNDHPWLIPVYTTGAVTVCTIRP